jgi:hypothetical protein
MSSQVVHPNTVFGAAIIVRQGHQTRVDHANSCQNYKQNQYQNLCHPITPRLHVVSLGLCFKENTRLYTFRPSGLIKRDFSAAGPKSLIAFSLPAYLWN